MNSLQEQTTTPTLEKISGLAAQLKTEAYEVKRFNGLIGFVRRMLGKSLTAETVVDERKKYAAETLSRIVDLSKTYRTIDFTLDTGVLEIPDHWGRPMLVSATDEEVTAQVPDRIDLDTNAVVDFVISREGVLNQLSGVLAPAIGENSDYPADWQLQNFIHG